MVVPEPRGWRTGRPHAVRLARAAKPHVVRGTRAVVHATRAAATRSMKLTTLQLTAGAAALGLAVSAGAVVTAGPWDSSGQRTAEQDWAASHDREGGADHGGASGTSSGTAQGAPKPAPSAVSVLTGLGDSVPAPTERALDDVLAPLLRAPALGSGRTAAVVDVTTGRTLFGLGADEALTPASTTKIATAAAALSAAGPDHRIQTRTLLQPDSREVVLVGGGDPTLTAHEDAGGYASLRTLAAETAAALKKRDVHQVAVAYDTSLYSGPALHPIGVNSNLAPVSALMVDEGRLDDSSSGPADRGADPAADAAKAFAELLADQGISTTSAAPVKASDKAGSLSTVESPPLSTLVERMLTNSDNDIAEALARQTALAAGEPASFEGAETAIRAALDKLGLPLDGTRFADGSGLNRDDRLTAHLLTALLADAASPSHPELRSIVTGLPVAGFTGTLRTRYADDVPGTGVVRAKTGTLTGVNTLAGTVVDTDGRLLAFAFMASETSDPTGAQRALDTTASALATCGCR
ncbi:D-alanyl-D-alanine carboxypeptidase/D-alanyl-D-alanine-endopeptidase [Streptomyces sp. NPDC046862]|uniref:D-alanyl-D-alanine carboxypeptidase/D-alanyl-D-alanine endopeptidase n=1 Tax=Streptomyces sp. NPDC046862 TaxID=3154603 RepID=UPI0034572640